MHLCMNVQRYGPADKLTGCQEQHLLTDYNRTLSTELNRTLSVFLM